MKWDIDKGKVICPQIYISVCLQIAHGSLKPNERLLSIRKISDEIKVNPNTIQKTFGILARKGVLYSKRNIGWFVSSDIHIANQIIEEQIRKLTNNFILDMQQLGLTKNEILEMIRKYVP